MAAEKIGVRNFTVGPKIVPAEVKAHRFAELDSLRGLGASAVFLGHFALISIGLGWRDGIDRSPLRVVFAGHEAVVMFFVLSGFVLSIPLTGSHPPGYGLFLVRRFCRLYLPYAAAILIASICDLYFYSTTHTGDIFIDASWSARPTLALVVGHLLAMPRSTTQINVAIWSLIYEIRMSMVFPLLLWVVRRVRPGTLLGICAVLSGGLPLVHHGNAMMAFFISPSYVAMFAGGILLWLHLPEITEFLQRIGGRGRGVALSVSLVFLLAPHAVNAWSSSPVPRSILELEDYVIAVGAAGLMACAIQTGRLRRILRWPILVRVGALSYSIYLMHPTVLFVLIRLFYGKLPFYYLWPVYLVGVYVVSELFHKFIDQPSVMLGRRVGRQQMWSEQSPA